MDGEERLAFLDEYGDTSLAIGQEGVTSLYIVVAIVVEPAREDELRAHAMSISDEFFSGAEIKSSKVGKAKDERRIQILNRIVEGDFLVHSVAVDKSRISDESGLVHKRSFIKYMYGVLFKRLFVSHPKIRVTADEHGGEAFMRGFEKYVDEHYVQRDFFSSCDFSFGPSNEEPLIQLADFVAGSMARILDPKKLSDRGKEIFELLRPKMASSEQWPYRLRAFVEPSHLGDELEESIRQMSVRVVLSYLEDNYQTIDPVIRARVEFLNLLLFTMQRELDDPYTPSHLAVQAITESCGYEIDPLRLRAEVVGPLRDDGILVVSSSSGYKLVESSADLLRFVHEVDRRVTPQLRRLGMMRKQIFETTMGKVDILEAPFDYLESAIQAISVYEPGT